MEKDLSLNAEELEKIEKAIHVMCNKKERLINSRNNIYKMLEIKSILSDDVCEYGISRDICGYTPSYSETFYWIVKRTNSIDKIMHRFDIISKIIEYNENARKNVETKYWPSQEELEEKRKKLEKKKKQLILKKHELKGNLNLLRLINKYKEYKDYSVKMKELLVEEEAISPYQIESDKHERTRLVRYPLKEIFCLLINIFREDKDIEMFDPNFQKRIMGLFECEVPFSMDDFFGKIREYQEDYPSIIEYENDDEFRKSEIQHIKNIDKQISGLDTEYYALKLKLLQNFESSNCDEQIKDCEKRIRLYQLVSLYTDRDMEEVLIKLNSYQEETLKRIKEKGLNEYVKNNIETITFNN